MALRFANGMFEPIWNRDRIDHVQITVAETVGVETRGRFYEKTGALRDMIPNHVFQLLAMVAMEPPAGFDAKAVRSRKTDVFSACAPWHPRMPCAANTIRRVSSTEKGCRPGLGDRDLCRHAVVHRQLALGRRAVLPAHRQAHVAAR